ISRLVPGGDLGFDLRAGGPTEPRLVAVGADRGIGRRIDTNRARVPGMEYLPAALARRRFLRPTRCVRAPVDCREIDVHAEPSEPVGSDLALSFGNLQVLRNHAGDRLTGIAAVRQQSFGGIETARAFENFAAVLAV